MQFMIDHYRERFPGCKIVIYDNMSSDKTVEIAKANDCIVIPFDTNGKMVDSRHVKIKDSCWKTAQTDWVIVCDLDELLDINTDQLHAEEKLGTTIISAKTYDMINMRNNLDIAGIRYGIPSPIPSKVTMFNKRYIQEINYEIGCHDCRPTGKVVFSKNAYKLYHYASLGEDATIKRFSERAKRLSTENLENRWGYHYLMSPQEIRDEYVAERRKAVKVR